MITTTNALSIAVPVAHFRAGGVTEEEVHFEISRSDNRFKAIPLMSREERLTTGLPAELDFVYIGQCIAFANDMEEDTLNAIKQIILELEVRELL